jgi:subtilisin family serine protease
LLKELKETEKFEEGGKKAATIGLPKAPPTKIKQVSKIATSIPNRYSVSFHTEENLKDAIPKIIELGGEIIGEYGNTITCSLSPEKVNDLSNIHGVKYVDSVKIRKLRNNTATKIMCGSSLSSNLNLPLTGKGEIIGVADTGIDTGDPAKIHADFKGRIVGIKSWAVQPEFKDRATNIGVDDGPTDEISGHGTHVAGSVLGNGQKSLNDPDGPIRGFAIEAELYFQAVEQLLEYTNNYVSWYRHQFKADPPSYELAGLPQDLKVLFQEAYDTGARIHTNSWGGGDPGVYDEQSEDVDGFVWEHKDMVILFAAGNDGDDKNGDGKIDSMSITPPGTAKNCICVGASENVRESGGYNLGGVCTMWGDCWPDNYPTDPIKSDKLSDEDSDIAAFSSRGPCIDNRFKPDVVAPGTNILSTKSSLVTVGESWGLLPSDDPKRAFYMYMGGTSMATPLTAGAVALIRQYLRQKRLNPSASLVKAALIHTALKKPYRFTSVPSSSSMWDFEQGWGHVNLKPFISDSDGTDMEFIDGEGLKTGELKDYVFEVRDSSIPFKVTLVYTDYPGTRIINNLNLIVSTPNGKDYHGNQFSPPFDSDFDSGNNVETVYIPEPIAGQYKVTILANNVSEGPQDYSLAVSGGFGEPPTGKGTIRGAVVYKSTNEPVEGAQVSTDTGQGISVESNGTYELDTVPIGNRTITARKDGYQAASTRVIVEEDKVATATTIGLEEESVVKAVNITGKVVYKSTSKPVEGAQVSADTGQSTVTDANGAYKLSGISIGDHAVTAFKAGYRCVCKLVTVKDSKIATIDFTLRSRKL